MRIKPYLISLPERVLRATVGLGAGVIREVGEIAIPKRVRRGQLYQNLVDTTLRFLIEQVGGAAGVYPQQEKLADDFLVRRTAGNAIEALGIVAFRASPVWVLAALADVCGASRQLMPEIAAALQAEGMLEKDASFTTVDQVLDGLERTSSRLASTINTPPLDVKGLREELRAIRAEATALAPARLPSREALSGVWTQLKSEAANQNRSVFELSSAVALSAVGRSGRVLAAGVLDDYQQTLREIRESGYGHYAARQLRPYLRAATAQFSLGRSTLTQKLIEKWRR